MVNGTRRDKLMEVCHYAKKVDALKAERIYISNRILTCEHWIFNIHVIQHGMKRWKWLVGRRTSRVILFFISGFYETNIKRYNFLLSIPYHVSRFIFDSGIKEIFNIKYCMSDIGAQGRILGPCSLSRSHFFFLK